MFIRTSYPFLCKEYSYSFILLCILIMCSCQKDIQSKLSQSSAICPPGTIVTDIDGNSYNVINIGSQCWMKENLKTTRYRNGDSIQHVMADSIWNTITSGAYCVYNNLPNNGSIYGNIYNSYAIADSRQVCPVDWHLPTMSEWNLLFKYLDSNADTSLFGKSIGVGGYLKTTGTLQAATGLWEQPNLGANDSVGFSALPGGYRIKVYNFGFVNKEGGFWTSSIHPNSPMNIFIAIGYSSDTLAMARIQSFDYGMSVRCIKD